MIRFLAIVFSLIVAASFIWNETPLQVAYTSDLKFVEDCLLEATDRDFKERYPHRATQ